MQIFELITVINEISPFSGAFSDDKVGLLIGKSESEVNNIIFAHDIDKKLLKICKEKNINTVLTYHPALFNDYSDLNYENSYGLPLDFLKLDINVISLHTALDVCKGGNSDVLAELFNLQNIKSFGTSNENNSVGRYGEIDLISRSEFLNLVEKKLNTSIIRYNKYFEEIENIKLVGFVPGSGTQFLNELPKNIDVFLTGDISHHHMLYADYYNFGIVQVNHISTEIPGVRKFIQTLSAKLETKVEYFFESFYG